MKKQKIYASILEQSALDQFNDVMSQDFVVEGALMADAHLGFSLSIGGVVATKDVVVPAYVGYDIGCGCLATQLNITKGDIRGREEELFNEIQKVIPVGINKNTTEFNIDNSGLTDIGKSIAEKKQYKKAVGTLGGGNHFLEIGYDTNDTLWIVIHSGSRGVGHGIASHYMKVASFNVEKLSKEFRESHRGLYLHNPTRYEEYLETFLAKKAMKASPKEGHFPLHTGSENGQNYIKDQNWCLDYALQNRKLMSNRTVEVMEKVLKVDISEGLIVNRNHNHALQREDGLWIHRKGATHAEKGMYGVIPANMKDGSFIVKGLGNPDSLQSSSHGAGRVLGRKEANRVLDVDEFVSSMTGVVSMAGEDTLDESPLAYKDINIVMDNQKDLVEIVTHITPLINIKG